MKREPRLLDKAFQRVVKSTMIYTNEFNRSSALQSPMGSDLTDYPFSNTPAVYYQQRSTLGDTLMKTRTYSRIAVTLLSILVYSTAPQAQEKPESMASAVPQTVEKVQLTDVLDAARRNSKKTFLINHHVQPEIVVGQIAVRDIDYALLLQILRNNDLAAVTIDGVVNVIPVEIIRQYPLPAIPNDDSLHDEEWVTGILPLKNAPAPSIVPIMRPMMTQAGHLAAYPFSNSVIIVDRLGNARRIFNLIRRMDQTTPPQTE